MLILLPPSETKRPAVVRGRSMSTTLALPSLAPQREAVIDALVALVRRRGRGRARPEARRHAARRGRRQRRAARRRRRCRPSTGTPACSTTRWTRHPSIRRPAAGSARHVAHPLGAVRPGRRARSDPRLPARRRGVASRAAAAHAAVGGCRHRARSPRRRRRSCSTCGPRPTSALGPVPAGVAVGLRAGRHRRRRGSGARAQPLQQAREGRARAPARAGPAARRVARRLRAVGGCRGPARARRRRRRARSCSPEPATGSVLGVLGRALGVLGDRDEGDDGFDDEPQHDDREERERAARG